MRNLIFVGLLAAVGSAGFVAGEWHLDRQHEVEDIESLARLQKCVDASPDYDYTLEDMSRVVDYCAEEWGQR